MFEITFEDSVNTLQKQWFMDAVQFCTFKNGNYAATVRVEPEPPCVGHADYMCTHMENNTAIIVIREKAEDPTQPFLANLPNPTKDVKNFFMESVVHELGHVVVLANLKAVEIPALCALFFRHGPTGEGIQMGTADNWTDGAWEDRIQEAVAETFKDAFLGDIYRVYDNRTNWSLETSSWSLYAEHLGLNGIPAPPDMPTYSFGGHEFVLASRNLPPNGGSTFDDLDQWVSDNIAVVNPGGSFPSTLANAFFGIECLYRFGFLYVPLESADVRFDAEFFDTPWPLEFDLTGVAAHVVGGAATSGTSPTIHCDFGPFILPFKQPWNQVPVDGAPPVIHMSIARVDKPDDFEPGSSFEIGFVPGVPAPVPTPNIPVVVLGMGQVGVTRGARL